MKNVLEWEHKNVLEWEHKKNVSEWDHSERGTQMSRMTELKFKLAMSSRKNATAWIVKKTEKNY